MEEEEKDEIMELLFTISKDYLLWKVKKEHRGISTGNKMAARRVRANTVKLEKLFKEFRKKTAKQIYDRGQR